MTHEKRITINSQIKSKTSMLKSCLCSYSDVYTLLSGSTIVPNTATAAAAADNADKKILFKKLCFIC